MDGAKGTLWGGDMAQQSTEEEEEEEKQNSLSRGCGWVGVVRDKGLRG